MVYRHAHAHPLADKSMHIVMASEPIHGLYLGFVNSVNTNKRGLHL